MVVLRKKTWSGAAAFARCRSPARLGLCLPQLGSFGRLAVVMVVASDTAPNALPPAAAAPSSGVASRLFCRLPPCATRSVGGHAPRSERPPAMPESLKSGVRFRGIVCRLPPCATRSVGGHAPRSERPPAMPESLKSGVRFRGIVCRLPPCASRREPPRGNCRL